MNKNKNLHKAKTVKNDEFYTQISDIEQELQHYKDHFKDKIVYCNCDDHRQSNFFRYFSLNFEYLGLKKLITTHFNDSGIAYKFEIFKDENGDGKINQLDTIETQLKQNGDFRSDEAVELLKECDIVVSNPPFSLAIDYLNLLVEHDKKFLFIGNKNSVTYKDFFKVIKDNKMWLGNTQPKDFNQPEGAEKKKMTGLCYWFTNLEHKKRNEKLILWKKYNPTDYPKYDNYDAIEVSKTNEIPEDYDGVMGVPISFLSKYCPEQFEIVGIMSGAKGEGLVNGNDSRPKFYVNNKGVYARILIKHKIQNNANTTETN